MKRTQANFLFVAVLLLGGFGSPVGAAILYTITDLHPTGEAILWSRPAALNEAGQIVVNVQFKAIVGPAFSQAYRTPPNTPVDLDRDFLGSLGGRSVMATDINELGQVVGTEDFSTNGTLTRAFRTEPNETINPLTDDLGTLGGLRSEAWAINDAGQVAGFSLLAAGPQRAFRTAPNAAIQPGDDLGTLGGTFSQASAINELGQTAGTSNTAAGAIRAFRTGPNAGINPATDNLGTVPGGSMSEAFDINDSGQVVGWARAPGFTSRAFLHDGLALIDIGTLGGTVGVAEAINSRGQVVGHSTIAGPFLAAGSDELLHAFLYEDGVLKDLNDLLLDPNSGWLLQAALDINDRGQIVGYGLIGDEQHAFLLTPIPEPATFALLIFGLAALIVHRYRAFDQPGLSKSR